MANETLKNALKNAGLTPEEFAAIIQVDPKTVQRWVAGTTTPYRRHRAFISRALDLPEHELWPDALGAPGSTPPNATAPTSDAGEVLGAWGRMNDQGAAEPLALLGDLVREVDALDPAATLLKAPGMLDALQNLAVHGTAIRLLTSEQTVWPNAEPRDGRVEHRALSSGPRDLIIFRADDTMLVAFQLYDGEPPPLIAIQRPSGGIYDRLRRRFALLWENAEQPVQPTPARSAPEPESAQAAADSDSPPRRSPRRPGV